MQENQKLKNDNEYKNKETIIKAVDSEIKAYSAETARMTALQQAMTPEQVQAIVMQMLQDLMTPNTVAMPQEQLPEPMMPPGAEMANVPPQGADLMMEQQNGY